MSHQSSNQSRSKNGNDFESYFTQITGIKKMKKKDKPKFTNIHGIEQLIDFDFSTIINGEKIYIDVTTTYRSDRQKQKAYNAMMMKTKLNEECKFYMVIKSLTENGKKKTVNLLEGMDHVIEIDEFIKLITKDNENN
jgi:hypothetical protein